MKTRVCVFLVMLVTPLPIMAAETQPAAADFSSPKAALRTLYQKTMAGDLDGVMGCNVLTEEEKQVFLDLHSDDLYSIALINALRTAFPAEAQKLPDISEQLAAAISKVDKMEEKIDGDRATLTAVATNGRPATEMKLVRVNKEWKFELPKGTLVHIPDEMKPWLKGIREVMVKGIADVKSGKYKSVAEAQAAIIAARKAVEKPSE